MLATGPGSRLKHLVRARRDLYRALRNQGWSLPAIADFCGGRDHTTILLALRPRPPLSEAQKLRAKCLAVARADERAKKSSPAFLPSEGHRDEVAASPPSRADGRPGAPNPARTTALS
jgi:hypothetical protein